MRIRKELIEKLNNLVDSHEGGELELLHKISQNEALAIMTMDSIADDIGRIVGESVIFNVTEQPIPQEMVHRLMRSLSTFMIVYGGNMAAKEKRGELAFLLEEEQEVKQ